MFCDVIKQVKFSTSPNDVPTHWKQTVFLLTNPVQLKQGKLPLPVSSHNNVLYFMNCSFVSAIFVHLVLYFILICR